MSSKRPPIPSSSSEYDGVSIVEKPSYQPTYTKAGPLLAKKFGVKLDTAK